MSTGHLACVTVMLNSVKCKISQLCMKRMLVSDNMKFWTTLREQNWYNQIWGWIRSSLLFSSLALAALVLFLLVWLELYIQTECFRDLSSLHVHILHHTLTWPLPFSLSYQVTLKAWPSPTPNMCYAIFEWSLIGWKGGGRIPSSECWPLPPCDPEKLD